MTNKIKVLIADDHGLVRSGLKGLIQDCPGMEVVAEANNGENAIRQAGLTKPDVVVVDISMPGMDGLEVITRLKAMDPSIRVIVLSMHELEYCVVQALDNGAEGYVTKSSAPEDLVKAIQKVHGGGRFLSEKASELLALRFTMDSEKLNPLARLSQREKQVLRGLARGKTILELSEIYAISPKTVSTYRNRLLEKLNLKNNVEIALFAVRNNLIEL